MGHQKSVTLLGPVLAYLIGFIPGANGQCRRKAIAHDGTPCTSYYTAAVRPSVQSESIMTGIRNIEYYII